jgi:hypothetical protein
MSAPQRVETNAVEIASPSCEHVIDQLPELRFVEVCAEPAKSGRKLLPVGRTVRLINSLKAHSTAPPSRPDSLSAVGQGRVAATPDHRAKMRPCLESPAASRPSELVES